MSDQLDLFGERDPRKVDTSKPGWLTEWMRMDPDANGFRDSMPLVRARELLRELAEQEGVTCPCCGQLAKVYPRQIHSTMARELIRLWRAAGTGSWFHLPSLLGHNGGDVTKCRYWGLLEEERDVRRDDGGRAGFWQITEAGEAYVHGRLAVPKYAHVYDGVFQRYDGPLQTIRQALGNRFDYQELMGHPFGEALS